MHKNRVNNVKILLCVRQESLAYLVGLSPTHLKPNQQGDTKLPRQNGNRLSEAEGTEQAGRNARDVPDGTSQVKELSPETL